MAEEKTEWTEQQRLAIRARGCDVLVTASAGTGKTEVLSGRCVDLLSERPGAADIRNMLILTFTDLAAEQMRSRIAEQLTRVFRRSGERRILQQLVLLQAAELSTIHSFCKRLITQYFHELALDPTFAVIDADEARLLKVETLEKTIEQAWRDSRIAEGLAQLLRRRDLRANGGFLQRVIQLSDFLEGIVDREEWYNRAIYLAQLGDPRASSLGEKQKQFVHRSLREILEQLRHALGLYEQRIPDGQWAGSFQKNYIEPVKQCLGLLEAGQWDQCARSMMDFQKPRFSRPGELPVEMVDLIHSIVKKAFDRFGKLAGLAVLNPDYLTGIAPAAGLQTQVLAELVRRFDRLYSRAKQSFNCLDFADLERHALRLLTRKDDQGHLVPSPTALALRERFQHIFVDEYQDINPVQQAILDALSTGKNLFVVGDVKQSIYAWRGAEPQIFLERLAQAERQDDRGFPVPLTTNFRSAGGLLDFVNSLFRRIMTAPIAGIDYDESAELRPWSKGRAGIAASDGPLVEIHILDKKSKDDEPEPDHEETSGRDPSPDIVTPRRRQAALLARRIKRMVEPAPGEAKVQIYDKELDEIRAVEYRDIVVLMRSLIEKANDYVEIFRLAGVPVSCEATAGYFQATEISDMLCLLKVLDNPQRDIELAAVLRSPLFGVTDSELAKIKLRSRPNQPGENLYSGVLEYSRCGPEQALANKLASILEQLHQWRTEARGGKLADTIWRIYRVTGYLSFVSALPSGQARRANLLKLHDRAVQFEGFVAGSGIPSLRRFVEFIEKLQEAGGAWAPAEPPASAGNAVRILSVHKSKGLEFPVVFLAGLETNFNTTDVSSDCLADAEDTLGLQIIDAETKTTFPSLTHQVIAKKRLSALLAEEMRILYVAMTRARERLKILTSGLHIDSTSVPGWLLAECTCPLQWILYGLSDQALLHEALETGLAERARRDDLFTFEFHDQARLGALSRYVMELREQRRRSTTGRPRRASIWYGRYRIRSAGDTALPRRRCCRPRPPSAS